MEIWAENINEDSKLMNLVLEPIKPNAELAISSWYNQLSRLLTFCPIAGKSCYNRDAQRRVMKTWE